MKRESAIKVVYRGFLSQHSLYVEYLHPCLTVWDTRSAAVMNTC